MGIRVLIVAVALFSFAGLASAGEPTASVTACDQVEIEGQTYPRFTFKVDNTSASRICSVIFQNPHNADPADSCTIVAIAGPSNPSGYETALYGNSLAIWSGCAVEPIEPGETGEGFRVVVTEACCAIVNLIDDQLRSVRIHDLCLQCPTPAQRATWGVVKSRYR